MSKFTLFYTNVFSQWDKGRFEVDGVEYNCAEQFMMASKARFFNDSDALRRIMKTASSREQQAIGRAVKNFNEMEWNAVARNFVYEGNYAKFTQNEHLKKTLLDTAGTILVEASPTDQIWGIGRAVNDPLALDRATWRGTNWLGEVLTKVRDDILAGVKSTTFDWA